MNAADTSRELAAHIDLLVLDLLPNGHREGLEWRCGSVAGEAGGSLGVHLVGYKRGVWSDFSTGQKGDALDLVRAVLCIDTREAICWARRWLGIADGEVALPRRSASTATPSTTSSAADPGRWHNPWQNALPIAGTPAEIYLAARGLQFDDRRGEVLRFTSKHPRRNATGEVEHHPALLALLSDIRSGEPAGIINIYMKPDGTDRLRDPKGKTTWGRAAGSAVMLSPFDDVTMGLTVCEGPETGIAILQAGLAPIWATGGAGNLGSFPTLAGIEALTIAADTGIGGQKAAARLANRWRAAGHEVEIITPPVDDWAHAPVRAVG